jgi:hypothetical protein
MTEVLELGFVVKGYPGSGRRVEDDSDLAEVSRADLISGAFMGDAVVRIGEHDFSTRFGWITMLDWTLRLSGAIKALETAEAKNFGFAESDDFVSFRRSKELLFVACSYQPRIAMTQDGKFAISARRFITESLEWISTNFPSSMRDSAMSDVLARIYSGTRIRRAPW